MEIDFPVIPVLQHGFVQLLEVMGSDASIAKTARVSVREAKTRSEDRALLRTLVRDFHTSPIEHGVMRFHIKMPIFVARQFIRHRMSSTSEVSGRYSQIPDEMHVWQEQEWRSQGTSNRQMSGDVLNEDIGSFCSATQETIQAHAYQDYQALLEKGVAREQARAVLPLATYTEFYWKVDCHNLMHFLKLRLAPDAQPEMQLYAQALYQCFQEHFPILAEAFEDYRREAVMVSRMGMDVLREVLTPEQKATLEEKGILKGMSKREAAGFVQNLQGKE